MEHYQMYIDGEFVDAMSGEVMQTIDPGTGEVFATVAKGGTADAEKAILAARRAFDSGVWSGLSPQARADYCYRWADEYAKLSLDVALLEAMDGGQHIRLTSLWGNQDSGLIKNLAKYQAHEFAWEEEINNSGNPFCPGRDYIRHEPLGVCVGIAPWNFPVHMIVQKIAFAIIMGNTVVVKPASITSITANLVARAVHAAGIPKGVVNVIFGPGGELGEILCTHPAVDKVSLTGSTDVGKTIIKLSADTIKRTTMELGGKSANIILEDADMDLAVQGAAFGTFWHQGQVCESGTRILVQRKIHDEFVEKLKKHTESLTIGYQLDFNTHIGPMASAAQLKTVEEYVRIGLEEGATLVTGGKRVEVPGFPGGYYYAPTIFTHVKNSMRIAQEEIFGPVVCVIPFETEEEAVAIANDSIYGLGGGVFSNNMARATWIAEQVRTGTMWINQWHAFADMAPFGGYKGSGFGRENGIEALQPYVQTKRVHVNAYSDQSANAMLWRMQKTNEPLWNITPYDFRTNVLSGKGVLPAIIKELRKRDCSRAVILTDEGIQKAGLVTLVQDTLGKFCVGVFDQIEQDTSLHTVDAAANYARSKNADCIISLGGGSVIDTGKAVVVALKNNYTANETVAMFMLKEPPTPHFVIPTTSGTGSEVTSTAVITNTEVNRKVFIADPLLAPDVAILDPRFTATLPKRFTVETAMDSMAHAVEAICGQLRHPFGDAQGLYAIRMIKQWLPVAMNNPTDLDARLQLQLASTLAGWAFSYCQVNLGHAMAHTLGALFHVPHGAACGLVTPWVMRFNIDHCPEQLAMIAEAFDVKKPGMSDKEAGLAAADAIEQFMKDLGHPTRLHEVGVPEERLDEAGLHACGDSNCMFNARPVSNPAEIAALYKQMY